MSSQWRDRVGFTPNFHTLSVFEWFFYPFHFTERKKQLQGQAAFSQAPDLIIVGVQVKSILNRNLTPSNFHRLLR